MKSKPISKRQWLTKIVLALGPEAKPAQIREEARRVGFGIVRPTILLMVRNSLWPDRPRRPGGYFGYPRKSVEGDGTRADAIPCAKCGSTRVWIQRKSRVDLGPGTITKFRVCEDCGHRYLVVESTEGHAPKMLAEKECTYCKRTLPLDSFSPQRNDPIRRPGCKECTAENRHHAGMRAVLRRHGLTVERYESMEEDQGHRCAICRSDNPFGPGGRYSRRRKRRVFSIDHCHETGVVRGLLCARCNLAIGNFDDDIDLLRAAITYLESRRVQPDG